MRLGPHGYDKIAILGSAPSSVALAPFDDPSWAIWGCSPATFVTCAPKRSDVWFELHRWQPSEPGKSGAPGTKPWFSPEFAQFLADHKGPVFMSERQDKIPPSLRYPFEQMISKYGPYFFTSSISLMLALAIEQQPKVIGLWGVDMAATEEYAYQRPGCQHFVGLALGLGINVVLPPESDLMRPPLIYGIGELNPRHIKMTARLAEFKAREAALQAQHDQIIKETMYLKGAIDDVNYVMQSWSDDVTPDLTKAISFSGEFAKEKSTGADVVDLAERAG